MILDKGLSHSGCERWREQSSPRMEVLINTLGESKETSAVVNKRVTEASITAKEIEAACAEYTPVATSGSIFYFVIAELVSAQAQAWKDTPHLLLVCKVLLLSCAMWVIVS
eukprot:962410-Amphidinium_carterae.1